MRRAALVAFALTACAGLVALFALSATDERRLAFTLGVYPSGAVAELKPSDTACQTPIPVAEPFTHTQFQVGTFGRSGQPLAVEVRSPGGRRLGGGTLAPRYPDVARHAVPVGRIAAGQWVEVCVRNEGARKVALYGGPDVAARGTTATLNGTPNGTDLSLEFLREESRSTLALVPDIFEHAGRFKPGWVGAWTFWVLGLLVLAGVPLLLAAAIASVRDPAEDAARAPTPAPAPGREPAPAP